MPRLQVLSLVQESTNECLSETKVNVFFSLSKEEKIKQIAISHLLYRSGGEGGKSEMCVFKLPRVLPLSLGTNGLTHWCNLSLWIEPFIYANKLTQKLKRHTYR